MAYYVAVKVNEKHYEAVNVKRSRHASAINYRYEEPCACTLQEINNITTTYENEACFKESLRRSFVLKPEHFSKPLVIFYADETEKRTVKGNVLYENSREMIENVSEVINYTLNKYKENDYRFFRFLAETLNPDSISKSIILKLSSLIEEKLVSENSQNKNLENEVITATKILIYQNDINEKGFVSPTNKLNYEAFHNLVSFIANYEENLEKEKVSGYAKTKQKS